MALITFEDKESLREIDLPAKNVIRAEDINQLKNGINTLESNSINVSGTPNTGDRIEWNGSAWVPSPKATATTGVDISFTGDKIYNSPGSPGTGNITNDLIGALIGSVQKIYHQQGSAPSVPGDWVLLGSGTYSTTALNIIYAEWVSGTRVEYWIIQEA